MVNSGWHVVSVTSRMELDTVARINSGGFVAHCPTYQKKYRAGRRSRIFLRTRIEPLFTGYIFVRADAAFRKDKFETSKVRLMVFRKSLLTEEQMTVINSTALELTMASHQSSAAFPIRPGEIMQILHGAMQGDHVEVLRARKDQILVSFKAEKRAGWRPAWINRTSLGRAI